MRGSVAVTGWLVLLGVAAGCGDGSPPEPREPVPSPARGQTDKPSFDALADLGYVDFADASAADGAASGVVLRDEARSQPGFDLVTSLPSGTAVLLDTRGEAVNAWREEQPGISWTRAELMPDGDLVVIRTTPEGGWLRRVSWEGDVRWELAIDPHHDVQRRSDGTIAVLVKRLRVLPALDPVRKYLDNSIMLLSPEGDLLEERSVYDLLAGSPDEFTFELPEDVQDLPPQRPVDLIHCNSVKWIDSPAGSPSARLVLTSRNQDRVILIDWEAERVLWQFGAGVLQGPHDAAWLDDGHVLLLDNGWAERGYSRVLEVDPATDEIVWEYRAPEPEAFFTEGRGTVQPLANGNVLVGNSNAGEAFEVTRAGEVVWRFLNPDRDADGRRAVLRVERYEPAYVEAILATREAER